MNLTLAPKHEQPIGGYKHPLHLLAYGPRYMAFGGGRYYETNRYCVAPSCSIYDAKMLRGAAL